MQPTFGWYIMVITAMVSLSACSKSGFKVKNAPSLAKDDSLQNPVEATPSNYPTSTDFDVATGSIPKSLGSAGSTVTLSAGEVVTPAASTTKSGYKVFISVGGQISSE